MKKYHHTITGIAFALIAGACEDRLNVDDPQNINQDLALSNDKNVKLVLTGGYNALSASDMFAGRVLRNSELLAANGEITFTGTYPEPFEIYAKQIITSNGNVSDFWISAYEAINIANNVIDALPVVNEGDRDQVEGEALFIRGLSYFELVKFFGQPYSAGNVDAADGVPLILTPTRELDDRVTAPRNSVSEVYNQVVDDLERATGLLQDDLEAIRASREAALAVLSRVYLQMGDYEKARDAANEVIESGRYELLDDVGQVFNGQTTPEDVFNIPVSIADGTNQMHEYYGATAFGGRGDIEIQQKHLDLYEEDDERLDLFYVDAATSDVRTSKWTNIFGYVKVIRLAEMFLTRAEANQRLGTETGASPLADVNVIRQRSGLSPLGSVSLEDILMERRVELAHEGQKLHDMKRLQQSVVEGATEYTYDDFHLVFPIPQRERSVNENLSQNEGYF